MMKILFSTFLFVIAVIVSCSSGYIINMDEATNIPEGRKLYSSKCNGCHNYYNPSQFTLAQWDSIMIPMQNKAKLSEEQKASILDWISERNRADFSSQNMVK